jgi:hypothetical protein
MKATVRLGPVPVSAWEFKKIPFPLSELVWIVSNFGNSYLSAWSSKNYETNSIVFIIF